MDLWESQIQNPWIMVAQFMMRKCYIGLWQRIMKHCSNYGYLNFPQFLSVVQCNFLDTSDSLKQLSITPICSIRIFPLNFLPVNFSFLFIKKYLLATNHNYCYSQVTLHISNTYNNTLWYDTIAPLTLISSSSREDTQSVILSTQVRQHLLSFCNFSPITQWTCMWSTSHKKVMYKLDSNTWL